MAIPIIQKEYFREEKDSEFRKNYPKVYKLVKVDYRMHYLFPIDVENKADYIYFNDVKNDNSAGFGGQTLSFTLEDGSVYKAKGPWHTNANDLYKNANIDLRETHLTKVIIGLGRASKGYSLGVKDVIYLESDPKLGFFSRGEILAKEYALQLNSPVVVFMISSWGSSNKWVYPEEWSNEDIDRFHKKPEAKLNSI